MKGVVWTAGLFGLGQLLRVVSSIILTRLLKPELFGILVIVYAVQNGVDMLSDLGFAQNLVINSNSDTRSFTIHCGASGYFEVFCCGSVLSAPQYPSRISITLRRWLGSYPWSG